jgi:hypothetical protein
VVPNLSRKFVVDENMGHGFFIFVIELADIRAAPTFPKQIIPSVNFVFINQPGKNFQF